MVALGALLKTHGPHMHRDSPVWLDYNIPDLRQNYLPIGPYEIVMPLLDMWSNHVHTFECLLDQAFHALCQIRFVSGK